MPALSEFIAKKVKLPESEGDVQLWYINSGGDGIEPFDI